MPSIKRIWEQTTSTLSLQNSISPRIYCNFIPYCTPMRVEDGTLLISTSTIAVAHEVESNCGETLAAAMGQALGVPGLKLDFQCRASGIPDLSDWMGEQPGESEAPVIVEEQAAPILEMEIEFDAGEYDRIVHPTRAVVLPGYFLRHVRRLGPDLAWVFVGIWQAAYMAAGQAPAGKPVRLHAEMISQYAGMTLRGFQKCAARSSTWQKLSGLVTRQNAREWDTRGEVPRRLPLKYILSETMPLTPTDAANLRRWLIEQAESLGGIDLAVQSALLVPRTLILPWENNLEPEEAVTDEVMSVKDVVLKLGGSTEKADMLQIHLMPPSDLLLIRLYFLRTWLPRLTPSAAWMITYLRDRAFNDKELVGLVPASRVEIAGVLGVTSRVRSVRDFLEDPVTQLFIAEQNPAWRAEGMTTFAVNLIEPIPQTAEDVSPEADGSMMNFPSGSAAQQAEMPQSSSSPGNNLPQSSLSAANNLPQSSPSQAGNLTQSTRSGRDNLTESSRSRAANLTQSSGQLDGKFAKLDAKFTVLSLLNSLSKNHKLIPDSYTSTTPSAPENSAAEGARELDWDLDILLEHNRVDQEIAKALKAKRASARAFVSWLLYGASSEGVRNPVALALAKLQQAPQVGAGPQFERLAQREDLAELISNAVQGRYCPIEWDRAMKKPSRERLRALAGQLALEVEEEEY